MVGTRQNDLFRNLLFCNCAQNVGTLAWEVQASSLHKIRGQIILAPITRERS